eukprot:14830181-Alexandrium_andersonii.AAC.1
MAAATVLGCWAECWHDGRLQVARRIYLQAAPPPALPSIAQGMRSRALNPQRRSLGAPSPSFGIKSLLTSNHSGFQASAPPIPATEARFTGGQATARPHSGHLAGGPV